MFYQNNVMLDIMKVTIFDTSVSSSNLGDFIIMEAVKDQLESLFPSAMMLHTYTHDKISKPSYHIINKADYKFVGGTNLLSSRMNSYNQWKINLYDSLFLDKIILLGVGWWQYQQVPNLYTKLILKSILHKEITHSVRDTYTEKMLHSIGIKNVINTSCPTMWKLTQEHCRKIPKAKADSVILTLTDYNRAPKTDIRFIEILLYEYDQVYFWPQGINDVDYIQELEMEKEVIIIPPTLKAFNELLKSTDNTIDYIGTRLHAGIKALQNKRRAIIVGIDNRAIEKAKDFNIQICKREKLNELEELIYSDFETNLNIPLDNIQTWKNQFT
jgi:polysaccharide pyruvyl transferase WcaK-like protein